MTSSNSTSRNQIAHRQKQTPKPLAVSVRPPGSKEHGFGKQEQHVPRRSPSATRLGVSSIKSDLSGGTRGGARNSTAPAAPALSNNGNGTTIGAGRKNGSCTGITRSSCSIEKAAAGSSYASSNAVVTTSSSTSALISDGHTQSQSLEQDNGATSAAPICLPDQRERLMMAREGRKKGKTLSPSRAWDEFMNL
ncbi:unnamed protein product [Amoebophrya sp. A25]|nr:unnamed protein product [Amoebophrya sp. A25]|eukprot:GSA25T00004224001.1